jgi:hypothetical protein
MGRSDELLKDKNIRRWNENLARGSKITASVRLRRLALFCIRTNTTPSKLVRIGKKSASKVEDIMHDHVVWLESQNYAPSYIQGIIKSVRSWLSYNYIELRRTIKIARSDIAVTLQDEKVPTKDELEKILNTANVRTRSSVVLVAFSGLRPQVLGNYDGTDGLKISDLPELVINGNSVSFTRYPAIVRVRPNLSKTKNKYFTFLPRQGCEYVAGYLRKRLADGEPLSGDSPVIAIEKGYDIKRMTKQTTSKIVTTKTITAEIRSILKPIINARPYVLRSYFDTQLLLAESNGKIAHAYRQFFMGHKGDIEAVYTTNKGRLSDELVEDMRRSFLQSEKFLCTYTNESISDKKTMLLEMWKEQAKLYGIDPMKIKIERQRIPQNQKTIPGPSDSTDDEIDAIKTAIQGMMIKNTDQTPPQTEAKSYESKLVDSEDELVSCIQNGWDVIRELNSGKVLLRRAVSKDWLRTSHHSN